MSVSFGFYSSINGDRKYSAEQMSQLFDGLINDGVFMTLGEKLIVSASTGMNVIVHTGRAWFNHTWTLNDADLPLTVEPSELFLNRVDAVVLEVDATENKRVNTIKIVKGTPATNPVAPTMVNTGTVHQHPLAHIYVGQGVSSIVAGNITNKVGTSDCPFVTGVVASMNIDVLVAQWQDQYATWLAAKESSYSAWASAKDTAYASLISAKNTEFNNMMTAQNALNEQRDTEFDTWLANIQAQLAGNVATNLQTQIDANTADLQRCRIRGYMNV